MFLFVGSWTLDQRDSYEGEGQGWEEEIGFPKWALSLNQSGRLKMSQKIKKKSHHVLVQYCSLTRQFSTYTFAFNLFEIAF